MIAAFHRSIESYWTRAFQENGRRRRLTTQLSIRVLRPEEDYSAGSLRLLDGGTHSAAAPHAIYLGREFRFDVPAHEFGHILGLPDEYVDRYSPEKMQVTDEQDRTSLMANQDGLLQSRHIIQIIEAMKSADRLSE